MRRPLSASPFSHPAATSNRLNDGAVGPGAGGAVGGANVSTNAAAYERWPLNASVAMATTGARRSSNNVNVNSAQNSRHRQRHHQQKEQRQQQQRVENQRQQVEIRRKLTEWYRLHRHLSPVLPEHQSTRLRRSSSSSRR